MKCEELSWSDVVSLVAAGLAAIAVVVAIAAVQAIAKGGCDCEECGEQCESAHEELHMIAGELEDSHNRDMQGIAGEIEKLRSSCEAGRCSCDCDCDCDCEAGRCDCEAGRCDCDCDCDEAPEPVVESEPVAEYESPCPGGVCPQTRPSRRGLLGWRR